MLCFPAVLSSSYATVVWSSKNATVTDYMDCGTSPLCGVLVLQTGLGPGAYQHSKPGVHGLWPEDGSYGSSACVKPSQSTADPAKVYTCYDRPDEDDPLGFETHEWEKHGECAGVRSADDYFTQICSLAAQPVQIMTVTRTSGHSDLAGYERDLESAGYSVFSLDEDNSQVFLSACAGSDGRWVLSPVASFGSRCKGSAPGPSPTPSPHCLPNTHGPPCASDADCHYPGCVRCANSGYCTNVAGAQTETA